MQQAASRAYPVFCRAKSINITESDGIENIHLTVQVNQKRRLKAGVCVNAAISKINTKR